MGGLFLFLSILFNGGIITIAINDEIGWIIFDVIIKVSIILLCFFFMIISIGNYKELTGKPCDWKEIILLFLLALVQSCLHPLVFVFTLIGLTIILFYLYLIQES